MRRTPLALIALALVATVLGLGMPGFSTAAFTSTSRSTGSITAAADWTPPTVSMNAVPTPLTGTATVTATASDGETGVATVLLQYLANGGGAWVNICTATAAPYSCAWNTKNVADGAYDVRAVATDRAGYVTTSATASTIVANSLLVVLASPGDVVRGSIPLQTTLYNAGLVLYTVRVEYAAAGTGTWKTLCTGLVAPYPCTWATTGVAAGYYDLRSSAIFGTTTTYSAVIPDVLVDNAAPTTAMTDPGTPLRGTVTLSASAADADSGIASLKVQMSVSGSSTWTDVCTSALSPASCRYDTTKITDGTYAFRSVATDAAGNTTTSTAVTGRVVDNTVSSISMEDPGVYLSGSVTLNATASSTAGVVSVRIQRAPSGTSTWTDTCTDTTSPYTCTLDTTTVTDGLYDFRAILLDGKSAQTTSAIVSARRVDNTPLRGADVQAANGGTTVGRLEPGDTLVLTYNDLIKLDSVTPGWTGTSTAVTVRLRDGNLLGLGNTGDTVDVLSGNTAVNLGSVNLKQEYVKASKTVTYAATMVAATVKVNGVDATQVTLTLGAVTGNSSLRNSSTAATLVWTPSPLVLDRLGRAGSGVPVNETGTLDRDF